MAEYDFAYLTSTTHPGFLNAPPLAGNPDATVVVAGLAWDGAGTLADIGDLALPNTSLSDMRATLQPLATALLARHHMVWLGGDHSITLPLLRAYRAHLGQPLALVHFDAHCDTWPDHSGEPSGHGTWLREAIVEESVDPRLTVQFGIRSPTDRETREYVRERGGLIYSGRDLRGLSNAEQLQEVCAAVRTRLISAPDTPVYLWLDIDCLDPAYAPGTGTPEPGGLATAQAMTLLEELYDLNWVGMDLCGRMAPRQ